MRNSCNFTTFLFAACVIPAVIHAQSADNLGNVSRHWTGRQTASGAAGEPGGGMARPAVRSSAYVYAAFPWVEGRPLTAIDYTLTPQGVVGSVGYIHIIDDHQIAPEAGLAASLGFSGPDSLVGAGLYYQFR
jgi:hypothetical protein